MPPYTPRVHRPAGRCTTAALVLHGTVAVRGDGALGSEKPAGLGGRTSSRSGAKKCDASYGRARKNIRARTRGCSDDRIAQGGSQAQGAWEQHSAQRLPRPP